MSRLNLTTTVKVRRPTLSLDISVQQATPDRWKDVRILFAGQGERGCWCQYWRQSSAEYGKGASGSGERNLSRQIADGPAPGMLAYVEGIPVGWLGFWPREKMERLVRSRTIPKVDDVPVWAIVCFMVRTGYRCKGIAEALLRGAIAHARTAGVPALEAYPVDAGGQRVDVTLGYVGFTSMFKSAGFLTVVETDARSAGLPRILMRLQL